MLWVLCLFIKLISINTLHVQIYVFVYKIYTKSNSILYPRYIQEKYLENSQIKWSSKTREVAKVMKDACFKLMVSFYVLSSAEFRARQIFLQCGVYVFFVYILLDFFLHVPSFCVSINHYIPTGNYFLGNNSFTTSDPSQTPLQISFAAVSFTGTTGQLLTCWYVCCFRTLFSGKNLPAAV